MKRKFLYIIIGLVILLPTFSGIASAQQPTVTIHNNGGIRKTGLSNYSFKCMEAETNLLVVTVQGQGYTDLFVEYNRNGTWVDKNFGFEDVYEGAFGQLYIIRLLKDGTYRLKAVSDINGTYYMTTDYIHVSNANGTYTNKSALVEHGKWVKKMYDKYPKKDTIAGWKEWAEGWIYFGYDPIRVILTPFIPIPYYGIIPYVWFYIFVAVIVTLWYYKRKIRLGKERDRYLKGKDITEKLLEYYNEKLVKTIMGRRLDDDLEDGSSVDRANAYAAGISTGDIEWNAQHTATLVQLASRSFSEADEVRDEAEGIIETLAKNYPNTLPKYQIFFDMAICCRKISGMLEQGQPNTELFRLSQWCFQRSEKLAPSEFIKDILEPVERAEAGEETLSDIMGEE